MSQRIVGDISLVGNVVSDLHTSQTETEQMEWESAARVLLAIKFYFHQQLMVGIFLARH